MFAPGVGKLDGWYVVPGRLKDGSEVDLYLTRIGENVTFRKPPLVSSIYPDQRWRKFLMNLLASPRFRPSWADYICRDWNISRKQKGTSKELLSFHIIFMRKFTLRNYRTTAPWQQTQYVKHCESTPIR